MLYAPEDFDGEVMEGETVVLNPQPAVDNNVNPLEAFCSIEDFDGEVLEGETVHINPIVNALAVPMETYCSAEDFEGEVMEGETIQAGQPYG